MLIIMADQLSLSVGNLYFGALIPGLLLGMIYVAYIIVVAQIFPRLAPAPKDLPPVTGALVRTTLLAVVPPLALIFLVLGSIFFGIATPTEASGLGAFGRDRARGAQRPAHLGGGEGGPARRPR